MTTYGIEPGDAGRPSSLRIRLLGGLELELGGERTRAHMGSRARELLCFLALDPGPHQRGALASRFWPDVLDQSARASLRTALYGLRRGLDGADRHLIVTRDRIGFDDNVWVDARVVAELAQRGLVREALDLCRGELAPELGSDWAVTARDEHRELVCDLQERLAAELETGGDLEGAVRATREQVSLDPLSEESNRRLVRRLAAAGDRPAALAAYSRFEERLRTELRVAPSTATRQLVAELRSGQAEAGISPGPGSPPQAARALDQALDAYVDAVGAIAAAIGELEVADPGELVRERRRAALASSAPSR